MRLPKGDYTIDSFLEELSKNSEVYFETKGQRKWLKTYLLYAQENWLSLFDRFSPEKNGELYFFTIPNPKDGKETEYYVTKFADGLIIVFTAEKQDDYAKTLADYINKKRGLTPMWIKPKTFAEIKNYIIEQHKGFINWFIAKRNWSSEIPAQFREDYNRTIHYWGEDGNDAIREMEKLYGVIPTHIDFRIGSDTMKITNDGLFVVHSLNLNMFRMVIEIVNNIIYEQKQIHNISTKIDSHIEKKSFGEKQLDVRQIESGKILFSRSLSTLLIQKLFHESGEMDLGKSSERENDEFAFIDTDINDQHGLSYSATVIDKIKGTVFGLSGTKDEMILVPMHRTTFETFIRFNKLTTESLDSTTNLGLLSDPIVAK